MYVILHGNPIDGLSLVGPFDDGEIASEYAEANLNGAGEWWIVEVEKPE
jgi:hypothetical protein